MILLETNRLILREFRVADAPFLLALDSDTDVMRFIGPNLFPTLELQRDRIAERFMPYYTKRNGLGFWAVDQKIDNRCLGWLVLRPAIDYRYATEAGFTEQDHEIGWRLQKFSWSQGFATEAAHALMEYGFKHSGVQRLVACALEDNRPSIRVMEKIGLQFANRFTLPNFKQTSVSYASPLERNQ